MRPPLPDEEALLAHAGPCRQTATAQKNVVMPCSFACAMHGVEGLIVRIETDAYPARLR